MAAVDDIWRSYRKPGQVVRAHLARSRSEPRLFTLLFSALVVIFVGQWPRLARQAFEVPDVPLPGLLLGTAMALAAVTPFIYLLAWLVGQGLRVVRGRGDNYGSRLALFWALLAVSPLMLLQGLVLGLIGPGLQANVIGGIVFLVFLLFWGFGLKVTQFDAPEARP
ncbi:YIP1 family protein [Rhodobacter lacus]|uniref:YIP1 family protein n=1 Tax=Rhodobacter lacus TaxID=1641972 RepID=A0ABW5AAJ9_9RHOB